jgi:hypothetical protein
MQPSKAMFPNLSSDTESPDLYRNRLRALRAKNFPKIRFVAPLMDVLRRLTERLNHPRPTDRQSGKNRNILGRRGTMLKAPAKPPLHRH